MRKRRALLVLVVGTIVLALLGGSMPRLIEDSELSINTPTVVNDGQQLATTGQTEGAVSALETLQTIDVKGRAAKTGYERAKFGDGWSKVNGCSTRDIILNRDLSDVVLDDECKVVSGVLLDPYTAESIVFTKQNSSVIQIDHVVALSDAWQKGAQQLTPEQRKKLANDPLELLAVSGKENQAKSDADAATWLPKNKGFRCDYIARQVSIKKKYDLWVTEPEKQAMVSVLEGCV